MTAHCAVLTELPALHKPSGPTKCMLPPDLAACSREKAYTVWNQKTGARGSNHGSRVDFILAAGPRAAFSSPAEGPNAQMSGATASSPTPPGATSSSPAADPKGAFSSLAAAEAPSSFSLHPLPEATQQVM